MKQRVLDVDDNVVHMAVTVPARTASPGTVASGLTVCNRTWVWATMKGRVSNFATVMFADYSEGIPTCFWCVNDRHR